MEQSFSCQRVVLRARVTEDSYEAGEVVRVLSVRSPFKQSLQKCKASVHGGSMSRPHYLTILFKVVAFTAPISKASRWKAEEDRVSTVTYSL